MSLKKNSDLQKYFIYLAAAFALFSYSHDFLKTLLQVRFIDFALYYVYSKIFAAGHSIWLASQGTQQLINHCLAQSEIGRIATGVFVNSAGFLLMVWPFTLLPYKISAVVWMASLQFLLALSVFLLYRYLKPWSWAAAAGIFLVCAFWPLHEDFNVGQANLLIVFFLTLAFILLCRGNLFCSGVCLGLAVQVKEIFLLLFLFFLFKRYWRVIIGGLMTLAVFKLIALNVIGIAGEKAYLAAVYASPSLWNNIDIDNLSLFCALHKITAGVLSSAWELGILFSVIAVICVLLRDAMGGEKKTDESTLSLEYSLAIVATLLMSPYIHESHFVVLLVPILLTWFYLVKNPDKVNFILLTVAYLLLGSKYSLSGFHLFTSGALSLFSCGKTLGLAILFALLCRILIVKRLPGKAIG